MNQCEYCRRVSSLPVGANCIGCGAPVRATGRAIIYDPRVFDAETIKFLGRPGVNIPVNLPIRGLKHVIDSIPGPLFMESK